MNTNHFTIKEGEGLEYIIIDVGTTNTRVRYVEDEKILAIYEHKIGVKDTAIMGSLSKLKKELKEGIEYCLINCNKDFNKIDKIVASGMITSSLGLVEIQHLEAPVGIEDISAGVVVEKIDEIVDKPIYFIPGVKNRLNECTHEVAQFDIMRGEEVEVMGILDLYNINENIIYISPGSHTKFIFINKNGEIEKCSTTLAGELLWALSRETILADSIPKELIDSVDKEYIKKGLDVAKVYGFSRACFLARIIDLFTQASKNQIANFIAGSIGYYDVKSIEKDLKNGDVKFLIGGKMILRELYNTILKLMGYPKDNICILDNKMVEKAGIIGAIRIVEQFEKKVVR